MQDANMARPYRYASREQLRFARVLGVGARASQVLLVASFLVYVLGIREPLIAVEQLPRYWGLPLDQFVKQTHWPTGWAWLAQAGRGDLLNLVGIAFLAAVPAFGSLAALPGFARRGEIALFVICLLQILLLVVSASSVFAVSR
jgi:hypothetical protein